MAVQYAQAMGLRVVALDVGEDKLELARALGAEAAIDARRPDAVAEVVEQTGGGAHGALVTAVSPAAFSQALGMVRRKGTISLVGLPPGHFETPIFDVVLKRITVRGSIVGTRQDLAEAVQFAARRKVCAFVQTAPLDEINIILDELKAGRISGRAVLKMA
jgi:propanol-preferring alcohol dehydrogenase